MRADCRRWLPAAAPAAASSGGTALFTGQGAARQFQQLSASQETLTTLAADTGGRAFTDTNDFGDAFKRVQRDLAAYYLLGYSSTNPAKDGKFRRIQVRLASTAQGPHRSQRPATTRTAASPTPIAGTAKRSSTISSPPLSRRPTCRWWSAPDGSGRRQTSSTCPSPWPSPASSVPVAEGATEVSLDVKGEVRDEQGRTIVEHQGDAGSAFRRRRVARWPAGALPVGRDAAAGPLLGEGRRAREHRRRHRLVRSADLRAPAARRCA